MNPYAWAAIIFGITIMFYLAGYHPLIFDIMGKYDGTNYNQITSDITAQIFSWDTLLIVGGGVAVATILTGGLNLLVIIPFALLGLILKFFVFPTSYITDSALPFEIKLIVTTFMYVTTYLVIIAFVRG